jgi:hypothetical protein
VIQEEEEEKYEMPHIIIEDDNVEGDGEVKAKEFEKFK